LFQGFEISYLCLILASEQGRLGEYLVEMRDDLVLAREEWEGDFYFFNFS
jgi:hypothetical protein